MKHSLAALTGVLLIGHGTVAMTASSVELKDQGRITPSAYVHTLSQDGAADLRFSASIAPGKTLNLTGEVPLDGSATVELGYL